MGIGESIKEEEVFKSAGFYSINNIEQLLGRLSDEKDPIKLPLLKEYTNKLYTKGRISENDWQKFQDHYIKRVEREEVRSSTEILGRIEEINQKIKSSGYRISKTTQQ